MGNQALQVNSTLMFFQQSTDAVLTTFAGNTVNNAHTGVAVTVRGSDWYWTVTAIMITAMIAFVGLAATKTRQQRIFHYITASITMVAAIACFSMASNLGWTGIAVEFVRDDPEVSGLYREIFYGKTQPWELVEWDILTSDSPLHRLVHYHPPLTYRPASHCWHALAFCPLHRPR
jgi:hypothetical protein